MDIHIRIYCIRLTKQVVPEVEKIVKIFKQDTEKGFDIYFNFIKKIKPSMEKIILEGLRDPIEVGHISSRLLRDPLEAGINVKKEKFTLEEVEGHIVGYLKAILQLLYCGLKGLKGWQYLGSPMHKKAVETQSIWKMTIIPSFLEIMKDVVAEVELSDLYTDRRQEKERKNKSVKANSIELLEYLDTNLEKNTTDIPFTARLIAYYRALESKSDSPLFVDPFAEGLAGDLSSYAKKHKFTVQRGDYPLVRSYFIEKNLLTTWCNQKETQVVLLGAGLDTRAYRFLPLKKNKHIIFEIDFEKVIKYKEKVLSDKKPLCNLVRVAGDLTEVNWEVNLIESGYSSEIPTFWILEGLVYYIDQFKTITLLKKLVEISHSASKIFVDVCVPTLAELVFGPFTRHFKWGLDKKDIPAFFAGTGWDVTCFYADDYNEGRDVGQRGLIFVQGSHFRKNCL